MTTEFKTIKIGEDDSYTIRLLPTTVFLEIQFEMDKDGMTPFLIKKAITNGAAIGSSEINSDRYEKHFRGKKAMQVFELFQNIMDFNLDPEGFDELGKSQEVAEDSEDETPVGKKPKRASKD